MATKTETRSEEQRLQAVIDQLKANRSVKTPSNLNLVERLADAAADSVHNIARVGAGFAAAGENARYSFDAERERQTRRTAQRLLQLAS